jgi:hypothetical protein
VPQRLPRRGRVVLYGLALGCALSLLFASPFAAVGVILCTQSPRYLVVGRWQPTARQKGPLLQFHFNGSLYLTDHDGLTVRGKYQWLGSNEVEITFDQPLARDFAFAGVIHLRFPDPSTLTIERADRSALAIYTRLE